MPRILLLLALLAAGCGGDTDEAATTPSETPRASAPSPSPSPSAAPSAAPSGGPDPDLAAVAPLVAGWQEALRKGDAATACRRLVAEDVRRRIRELGGRCERDFLAERIAEAGPGYRLEVLSAELRGARGTLTLRETGKDGASERRQTVVREGGRWTFGV